MSKDWNPQFDYGSFYTTPGVKEKLTHRQIIDCLLRHIQGDFGDISEDDWEMNVEAIEEGGRIFSAYDTDADIRIWIITEADRSVTTVLLPSEY